MQCDVQLAEREPPGPVPQCLRRSQTRADVRLPGAHVRGDNRLMTRSTGVSFAFSVVVSLLTPALAARTINVTPEDSYDVIEGAQAGDEVVIAPGTYAFRVYLEAQGTPSAPIVIRAQDPDNPPVWDLSSGLVEDAPGSYTAGDRGRGCWQFSGAAYIELSGIVITGCHNEDHNSAGIRYYNGSTGIVVRDVVFRDNDNGLTGGTQGSEITVEYSEFESNGNLEASAPTHNLYIYGGTFTLRHSYVHDPIQGQNFHIRAEDSVIEYNWFSRARSYQGDLMSSDDYGGGGELTQTLVFRGNVVVQGDTQANDSQIIAVYNDTEADGLTLNVDASYNTFIGNGGRAGFVHLSNADSTPMSAVLTNNLLFGTERPVYAEDDSTASISGSHNWLMTGAEENGLLESIFGEDPGFTDADTNDFTLAQGSTAIGAAAPPASGAPGYEYYKDENAICLRRVRASAHDVGAFESTTSGDPTGPYEGAPLPPTTGGAGGTGTGGSEESGGGNAGSSESHTTGGRTTSSGGNEQQGGASPGAAGESSGGEQGGSAPDATGGRATSSGGDGQQRETGGTGGRPDASAGTADATGGASSSTDEEPEFAEFKSDDDGGCGCRLGGSRQNGNVVFALMALAVAGAARQKSRQRLSSAASRR